MKFRLSAFADEASASLGGQIKALTDNGIGYLEIRGVDGKNISNITIEKAKEIRKRLDDSGISVWSIGSPFGKIDINKKFEPHLDKFRHCLEFAEILGAKHMRLFSFYGTNSIDPVLTRLRAFTEAADGSGIMLCHENEKGIYGDTAEKCLKIHKALPQLRAIFDPANFIQCGQDTKTAWEMLSAYVEYMHIKDALPDGTVVPAGKGAGNIPFILDRYKGEVLTVEPHLLVFDGLDRLEAKEKTGIDQYRYPSSRAAFDAAVNALKELL